MPGEGATLLYLGVWVTLFFLAWTMMYIPYLSWGVELADDYAERSRVTGFREAATMIGILLALLMKAAPTWARIVLQTALLLAWAMPRLRA